MCDRFNDQGTLDNVLLSPHLTLGSKRAMLLVSRFFNQITDAHLSQPELHVSEVDCTIRNARFVIHVLIPRVPGLLVCARGEVFAPKMDLAKLVTLQCVRVATSTCCMGPAASYFLGHALAHSEGCVRLTMGRKKSLKSLRERGRIHLDCYERMQQVDCNLLAGALLANAEKRIADFDGKTFYLSEMYLDCTTIEHLRWPVYAAFDPPRSGPYQEINLSHNPIGVVGASILVDALCNRRRCTRVRVQALDLSYTELGNDGIRELTAPMNCGGFKIKELYLAGNAIGNEGMVTLMHGLRALADRFAPPRKRRDKEFLEDTSDDVEVLDVSYNRFGDQGFRELLDPTGLSRLRVLHVRKLRSVSKKLFVEMGHEVRKGLYKSIQDIYNDTGTTPAKEVPLNKAVRYWAMKQTMQLFDDEWTAFERQFASKEREREQRVAKRLATGDGTPPGMDWLPADDGGGGGN
jgi:hypothetical protein